MGGDTINNNNTLPQRHTCLLSITDHLSTNSTTNTNNSKNTSISPRGNSRYNNINSNIMEGRDPGPSPHSQEQAAKVDTTEKRQSACPASNSAAPEQKQVTKVESVKQAAEEQEEDVDPKLRDFTLIISKLLFQLSQL